MELINFVLLQSTYNLALLRALPLLPRCNGSIAWRLNDAVSGKVAARFGMQVFRKAKQNAFTRWLNRLIRCAIENIEGKMIKKCVFYRVTWDMLTPADKCASNRLNGSWHWLGEWRQENHAKMVLKLPSTTNDVHLRTERSNSYNNLMILPNICYLHFPWNARTFSPKYFRGLLVIP